MKIQESSSTGGTPAPASNHLFAYSVEEYDAGNGKKGRAWTRIGAAFPHKEGPGFNIELKSIPLDGRIVLLPPDESRDATVTTATAAATVTATATRAVADCRLVH